MARDLRKIAEIPGVGKIELREQLQVVQSVQKQQGAEIGKLDFLFSAFVTDYEMSHPTKLATFQEFAYAMSPAFESEIRELRARGLIEPVRDDVPIAQLKREGDLKHYFRISARGRRYLTLLNEAVADASAPSSAR